MLAILKGRGVTTSFGVVYTRKIGVLAVLKMGGGGRKQFQG